MNFIKGQKAVTVSAIINKCSLQRRFDSNNFGAVNITFYLFAGSGLELHVFNFISIYDNNAGFFRLRIVN